MHDGGTSTDVRQALGERAKQDAAKEPLFEERREERRHECDQHEAGPWAALKRWFSGWLSDLK